MNKRVQEIFNLITILDKKGADIEEVLENVIWESNCIDDLLHELKGELEVLEEQESEEE